MLFGMALTVETETGRNRNVQTEDKHVEFYFKFRRVDEALVACFMPDCETPVKDGWSDFKNGQPAGYKIKSMLEDDGISFRADCPKGYSYFSAQMRMVVDVGNLDSGREILKLFEEVKSRAKLDSRYLNRVRVHVGSCDLHRPELKDLEMATIGAGHRLNREILEEIISH